jgi:hypothetical protein
MKFKMQRQEIAGDLVSFSSNLIKKNKIDVPRASKKIVNGMPAILKEIKKKGLPNYLVIKKLKKKLGYGVFLHPDAKPILKGSPIAPYSGKVSLCPQNMGGDSDYIFSLIPDLRLTKEEQRRWDPTRRYHPRRLYSLELDAYKKGNFTRFINHSEEPNVEAHLVRIPSNSVGLEPVPFELVYVAKKTIYPGEQLLVCYEGEDKSYWGVLKIKPFPITPRTFFLNKSCKIVAS